MAHVFARWRGGVTNQNRQRGGALACARCLDGDGVLIAVDGSDHVHIGGTGLGEESDFRGDAFALHIEKGTELGVARAVLEAGPIRNPIAALAADCLAALDHRWLCASNLEPAPHVGGSAVPNHQTTMVAIGSEGVFGEGLGVAGQNLILSLSVAQRGAEFLLGGDGATLRKHLTGFADFAFHLAVLNQHSGGILYEVDPVSKGAHDEFATPQGGVVASDEQATVFAGGNDDIVFPFSEQVTVSIGEGAFAEQAGADEGVLFSLDGEQNSPVGNAVAFAEQLQVLNGVSIARDEELIAVDRRAEGIANGGVVPDGGPVEVVGVVAAAKVEEGELAALALGLDHFRGEEVGELIDPRRESDLLVAFLGSLLQFAQGRDRDLGRSRESADRSEEEEE